MIGHTYIVIDQVKRREIENKKVEIIEFTDPACTWCWGSELVLRKLKAKVLIYRMSINNLTEKDV